MPNATTFKANAPLVTREKSGIRGELRAGGRVAAQLGAWYYKATKDGWFIQTGLREQNEFLIDHGAEFEVRLVIGNYVHVSTECTVIRTPGRTDVIAIVGTQKLEKMPRYDSGHKTVQEFSAVRAIRLVPGGNQRSPDRGPSHVSGWDPARGRVLVRVDGDTPTAFRRGPVG